MHKVIFHLSLKKQSYHSRKVELEDKGRNWLTLSYSARERPSSQEHLPRDFLGLLLTEFLTASTLSGHFVINFLPDMWFSAFFLRLFTDSVAGNLAFLGITVKLNVLWNFACTVLNDFVSKEVVMQNFFFSLIQGIVFED